MLVFVKEYFLYVLFGLLKIEILIYLQMSVSKTIIENLTKLPKTFLY